MAYVSLKIAVSDEHDANLTLQEQLHQRYDATQAMSASKGNEY